MNTNLLTNNSSIRQVFKIYANNRNLWIPNINADSSYYMWNFKYCDLIKLRSKTSDIFGKYHTLCPSVVLNKGDNGNFPGKLYLNLQDNDPNLQEVKFYYEFFKGKYCPIKYNASIFFTSIFPITLDNNKSYKIPHFLIFSITNLYFH